jgi:hypothetical protein
MKDKHGSVESAPIDHSAELHSSNIGIDTIADAA